MGKYEKHKSDSRDIFEKALDDRDFVREAVEEKLRRGGNARTMGDFAGGMLGGGALFLGQRLSRRAVRGKALVDEALPGPLKGLMAGGVGGVANVGYQEAKRRHRK